MEKLIEATMLYLSTVDEVKDSELLELGRMDSASTTTFSNLESMILASANSASFWIVAASLVSPCHLTASFHWSWGQGWLPVATHRLGFSVQAG